MVSPQITFDTAARQGMPRTLANARVLVDECVSPNCLSAIADIFGTVDSVQSLGLSGTKDRDLIEKIAGLYDIIVTRDVKTLRKRDMAVCLEGRVSKLLSDNMQMHMKEKPNFNPHSLSQALRCVQDDIRHNSPLRHELQRLPLLVGLRQQNSRKTKPTFFTHKEEIENQLQCRSACGIKLSLKEGVQSVIEYDAFIPRVMAKTLADILSKQGMGSDPDVRTNLKQAFSAVGFPVSTQVYLAGHLPSVSSKDGRAHAVLATQFLPY